MPISHQKLIARLPMSEVNDHMMTERETEYQQAVASGLLQASDMIDKLKNSSQTIRLHAGELSANEMRAVKAVLNWVSWTIKEKAAK